MILTTFWEDAWEGIKHFFKSIGDFFLAENEYGLTMLSRIIISIIVLVLGVLLIKAIIGIIKRASGIKKGLVSDLSAKSFFIEAFKIFLYFALAFAVIGILGINVTGMVGIISAVTVALGLALQDIIGMFASGILIFNSKNFHTGDYIKVCNSFGTEEGTVFKISLLYTTLLTVNGQKIHIPNNNITKANVTNFSDHENRRGIISIILKHNNDSDEVVKAFIECGNENSNVLKDPKCFAYINEFKDFGVEYCLRFYTELDKYWDTLFELREQLFKKTKEKGFIIASSTDISIKEKEEK